MVKMTEYMALSRPIVAFDLTEHRATAEAAALYAQPNSELDFAKQIARLMDDPALRKQLGEHGRKRIETQLAWHHQAKHLLAVYAELNGKQGRPFALTKADMQSTTNDPVYVD